MSNGFSFTVLTSETPLGKRITRGTDGLLVKKPLGNLWRGTAEVRHASSLEEFAQIRAALTTNQALTFGCPAHPKACIVAQGSSAPRDNALPVIHRDRASFSWSDGAGLLMLDHDPAPGAAAMTAEELVGAVADALPVLAGCPMLWAPSAGSCVYDAATGAELIGIRGSRLYVLLDDARRAPEVGELLFARLVLRGHGRIVIGQSGSMYERGPVDTMVWQPERLDFAGAVVGKGLVQRRGAWKLFCGDTDPAPASELLRQHGLSATERQALALTWADLKREAAPDAAEKLTKWAQSKARQKLGDTASAGEVEALSNRLAQGARSKRLAPEHILHLQDGTEVTVADVLKDPHAYSHLRLADPLEPDYGGDKRIAMFVIYESGAVRIHSHAHGEQWYVLRNDSTPEADFEGLEDDDEKGDVAASPCNTEEGRPPSKKTGKKALTLWSIEELMQRPPAQWRVKDWIPMHGTGCLFGPPNTGKSLNVLHLSLSIARGERWHGIPCKPGGVVYVAAEGGHGFASRLKAYAKHNACDIAGLPFRLVDGGIDLRSNDVDTLRVIEACKDHAATWSEPVALIVLDTLARVLSGGNENASEDMGKVLAAMGKIAHETGAFVLAIHHSGKDLSAGGRGHSSLLGAIDTEIKLTCEKKLGLMELTKQRDGPKGLRLGYTLEKVDVGADADGETMWSATVVPCDAAVGTDSGKSTERKLTPWQARVVGAWHPARGYEDESPSFQDMLRVAEGQLRAGGAEPISRWRDCFKRAYGQLIESGRLGAVDGRVVLMAA